MSRLKYVFGVVLVGVLASVQVLAETGVESGKVQASSAEVGSSKSKTGLIFSLRPEVGFVNPKALNDSTTAMNTAVSGLYKVSGADAPMVNNTVQAALYLGYAWSEDFDFGAFFSIPPITTKKMNGLSASGVSALRTSGMSANMFGLQANYTISRTNDFRFYGSPSIGWGTFSIVDKLDYGAASYDIVMESKNIALKGSLGVAYQISSWFSLQGEAGYMYWNSGSLKHKNAFAAKGISAGDNAKNSTGDGDLKTDLSGPFVGVGLTFSYPI